MTPDEAQAVAKFTRAAVTVVEALNAARVKAASALSAAPKGAPADEVEKAAAALVETRWLSEAQRADAVAALSDHATALQTLSNLAHKAAAAGDPRLEAGSPEKAAAAVHGYAAGESPADHQFRQKMTTYRRA